MFVADSLLNLTTGLGTEKDRLTQTRFVHTFLGPAELDAMYSSNWLAGKIIDVPPDDMTREWRTWDGGPKQTKALTDEEGRLGIRAKVNRAMKLARLYGGAAMLLGTGDPNPALPLDITTIRRGGLQYVQVLSRWEMVAGPLERDPLSEHYGEPTYYELFAPDRGSVQIHPSRVVRFFGQARIDLQRSIDGWGLSTLQRVYEAVKDATATPHAVALLAQEAKVNVINVPGLTERSMDPDYVRKVVARFGLANQAQGLVNALLLDGEEKWGQKTANPNGWPAVIHATLEIAAGAADIPVTRLLGAPPKGMNATGESDTRNYYDMLHAKQEVELRPVLHRLDDALARSATGSRSPGLTYSWNSLWQMSEAAEAAISLQHAQVDDIYASLGIMSPDAMRQAIRSRILQDGIYPGLPEALANGGGVAPAPLISKAERVETNSPKPSPAKP